GAEVRGDPGQLMRERATVIKMLYPQIEELRCLVYSASGYNKGKDMLKSSFHLVWPQLVVDPDSAPLIRELTLIVFKEKTNQKGHFLRTLQEQLMKMDDSNEWELVFDKTTINATNGLRLPYNDKASKVPIEEDKAKIKAGVLSKSAARKVTMIEKRPSKAVGELVFTFQKNDVTGHDEIKTACWEKDAQSWDKWLWIKNGSCRIDACDPERSRLTPLQPTQQALDLLKKHKKARKPGQWILILL
ncbi:unnamed protein product, partial [Effrenium voratum]